MGTGVFYCLCLLSLQNLPLILGEDPCKDIEACTEEVDQLIKQTENLLNDIGKELKYVNEEFAEEVEDKLNKDYNALNDAITNIDKEISPESTAKECVSTAETDLEDVETSVKDSKENCKNTAKAPSTKKLTKIQTQVKELNTNITEALEKCSPESRAIKIKTIRGRQYTENEVTKAEELVLCLQNIIKTNTENVRNQSAVFEDEKTTLHHSANNTLKDLENCLGEINFCEKTKDIVPNLEKCVTLIGELDDINVELDKIEKDITTAQSKVKGEISAFETKQNRTITEIVENKKYDIEEEYKKLVSLIENKGKKSTSYDELCKERALDEAAKIYNNQTAHNLACKTTAISFVTESVKSLTKSETDLKPLNTNLKSERSGCLKDKDHQKQLTCLKNLSPIYRIELYEKEHKFNTDLEKINSDAVISIQNLTACLKSKNDFNEDSKHINSTLKTCEEVIEDLDDINVELDKIEKDITTTQSKVKGEISAFETKQDNTITDIVENKKYDIEEEYETLVSLIENKEKKSTSYDELCKNHALDEAKKIYKNHNKHNKGCASTANSFVKKSVKSLQKSENNLKNLNSDLKSERLTCSKVDIQEELNCLNNLNTYITNLTDIQNKFNTDLKKVNGDAETSIQTLTTCLKSKDDFKEEGSTVVSTLGTCKKYVTDIGKATEKIGPLNKKITENTTYYEINHPKNINEIVDAYVIDEEQEGLIEKITATNLAEDSKATFCVTDAKQAANEAEAAYDSEKESCKKTAEKITTTNKNKLKGYKTEVNDIDKKLKEEKCEEDSEPLKCLKELADFNKVLKEINTDINNKYTDAKNSLKALENCLKPLKEDFTEAGSEIIETMDACIKENAGSRIYLNSFLFISIIISIFGRM